MTDHKAILQAGLAKAIQPAKKIGCCRVYVTFDKADAKGVEKAAANLGKRFQKKAHYGLSNALYVGYDNCDGVAIARAEAIQAEFAAKNIGCCIEYCGD